MTKINKLIHRFESIPKDFTWDELTTLLEGLGFEKMEGRGSRVKFYNAKLDCIIHLHRPHPKKIIKSYIMKEVLAILTDEKLL